MSEMVERVALACAAAAKQWRKEQPSDALGFSEHIAHAALAALREPTEAMIDAADNTVIPGGDYGTDTFRDSSVDKADILVLWQAMIDAALNA